MATPITRPWRARALAVIAAALAALGVWLVTDPLLGIDLTGPTAPGSQQLQPIAPAMVAGASLVTGLAGWALLALLERFTARARTIWTAIAVLVVRGQGLMSFGVRADMSVAGQARVIPGHHLRWRA
jgi:ABC-type Na+ efflux pump permease subunit